ncbi:MAG: hypothetical protein A2Y71_10040 [Bacteroidetes bacterium RBG_13_42_15]|nr:MAG: hypothetical protein A2Y71_10040 [Bacteroidetes bacterium RBG_13_42_15]
MKNVNVYYKCKKLFVSSKCYSKLFRYLLIFLLICNFYIGRFHIMNCEYLNFTLFWKNKKTMKMIIYFQNDVNFTN